MTKPAPLRYRTTNCSSYNQVLIQRGFLTFKVLFGLPLRQTVGLVSSLLLLSGLDWPVPGSTTLCRRQKILNVNLPFRSHDYGALHLLVDSTGIKMMGEGEWERRKHGPSYRRQWCKLHLGIDARTLDIRAIEVSDSRTGDAPVLPLLDHIPEDEQIATVSGDGAYDMRACLDALAARNALAVIPG